MGIPTIVAKCHFFYTVEVFENKFTPSKVRKSRPKFNEIEIETFQYFYTDISAISVTFRNSVIPTNYIELGITLTSWKLVKIFFGRSNLCVSKHCYYLGSRKNIRWPPEIRLPQNMDALFWEKERVIKSEMFVIARFSSWQAATFSSLASPDLSLTLAFSFSISHIKRFGFGFFLYFYLYMILVFGICPISHISKGSHLESVILAFLQIKHGASVL